MVPDPFARPADEIDEDLAEKQHDYTQTRTNRDRRRRDICEALRDVERYENQLGAIRRNIDGLLDERNRSTGQDLATMAEQMVKG